ncbi:MAG: BRO family protein [Neisseria sp.]|nr:BRO family protein [Neisseria sp.]
MSNCIIFSFENSTVTVLEKDGEIWFQAASLTSILGFKNGRQALSTHVDEEDVQKMDTLTKGGKQKSTYVNESGMYSLIFGSTKPEAKTFKRWVTSEVLPQIRKTGSYTLPTEPRLSDKQVGYLYQSVMRICAETGQPYQTVFGGLKRHFGVASYKHLAPKDFQAACAWLGVTVKTFEGEVIDAPDNWESCRHNVQSTLNAAEWVCYWFTHHYPALKLLNPHAANFIIDHVKDMKLGIGLIRSRMNWNGMSRQHMEYFPWNGSNEQQQHYRSIHPIF